MAMGGGWCATVRLGVLRFRASTKATQNATQVVTLSTLGGPLGPSRSFYVLACGSLTFYGPSCASLYFFSTRTLYGMKQVDPTLWKCRNFRQARPHGALLGSLIIFRRWAIEWYHQRLTKITPSSTRSADPRPLRSGRHDGFRRSRAGSVAIFDRRGLMGRCWAL